MTLIYPGCRIDLFLGLGMNMYLGGFNEYCKKVRRSIATLLVAFGVAVLACLGKASEADDNVSAFSQHTRLLEWLPADTEEIIVFNQPFSLRSPTTPNRGVNILDTIHELPRFWVSTVPDEDFLRALDGKEVIHALQGAKDFRAPQGFGGTHFAGALLLCFAAKSNAAIFQAVNLLIEHAPQKLEVDDHTIAVFKFKEEGGERSLLITVVEPGVLGLSTDQAYLEEILRRKRQPTHERAISTELPEWQHVDVNSPVWAIRHYCADMPELDPTSPRCPKGWMWRDPAAIGFVAYCDQSGNALIVKYLSNSESANDLLHQYWKQFWSVSYQEIQSTIKQQSNGIVEIVAKMGGNAKSDATFLEILMWMLGYGIVV